MTDVTRLRVQDALVSAVYRVYPDTPLAEVIDLMARREIRAVPVVGEQFEVLGVITSGDALEQLLRQGPPDVAEASPWKQLMARDVMTRTVLCVSDEQPLVEAAQMMVNRDVEQLPVVHEGAFIGFVTRDTILRVLQGGAGEKTNDEQGDS